MTLYERFVARLTLGIFASLAVALVALFLVIDFGDWLRIYTGKDPLIVAELYWYRSHLALVQFAPAALVLAAGMTVTVLRRRGEWTALRALGASPTVVLRPVVVAVVIASVGLLAFQEFVVSVSGPRVDRMMMERFDRWGDFLAVYSPRRWFRAGPYLINVRGEANPERLEDVRLFELGPQSELVRWIEVQHLTFVSDGTWRMEGVNELIVHGPEVSEGPSEPREFALPLRPEVTQLAVGRPEWLPLRVLGSQVGVLAALKLPTEAMQFAVHQRWAATLGAILAAFLAGLLGLRPRAVPSIPRALLEGAGLYGALFLASMIERSLAINGRLPASLAAWSLPLMLALACAWLLRRGQTT